MYREPIADRERFDAVRRSDQLHSMNLNEGLYRSTVCICTLSIYTIGEGVKSKRRRRPIDRIQSFLYSHRSILQFYTYNDREICSFGCKKSAWTEFFFFLSGRKKGKKIWIHSCHVHPFDCPFGQQGVAKCRRHHQPLISSFRPPARYTPLLRTAAERLLCSCKVYSQDEEEEGEKKNGVFSILLMD